MPSSEPIVVRVAVAKPLRQLFDYSLPLDLSAPTPGARVRVPFGSTDRVGVCIECGDTSDTGKALKPILAVIDAAPLLPPPLLELIRWAADYYHHPLGEVVFAALPAWLREGRPLADLYDRRYRVLDADLGRVGRAQRQRALLEHLLGNGAADAAALVASGFDARLLRALEARGSIEAVATLPTRPATPREAPLALNSEQRDACEAIRAVLDRFEPLLLHGVTGSGKTEVYLNAIDAVLTAGKQALVLVPEIALTPQTVQRFRARFGAAEVYHSGLPERERAQTWEACRTGRASVLIGTRSAVFVPFPSLGIIVVDEEHDGSFKQQEGFRYSARDLAVLRARDARVPIVLGTATPALETLQNVRTGRYRSLELPRRTGSAAPPRLEIIDVRGLTLTEGLSPALLRAARAHLEAGNQTLFFINRRGYAPSFICTACGWAATCSRCEVRFTLHRFPPALRCHHCGADEPVPSACPNCTREALRALGFGTQRTAHALAAEFPDVPIVRIDRDTTRTEAKLTAHLDVIARGEPAILVGTQMLAKGHHFPRVTLVAILNADLGFASADFRAPEHTAQLIEQVAGRAGRADRPGEVLIQSFDPAHPLLTALVEHGYRGFADAELPQREAAGLPPFRSLALLRAEGPTIEAALACIATLTASIEATRGVEVWGPAPAPMVRRADRMRAQAVVIAPDRRKLARALERIVAAGAAAPRRTRWSLDVDPYDMV